VQGHSIVLATRNSGKIREIRAVLEPLGVGVLSLTDLGDIPEPPETGETFAENAHSKALYYARATGRWCLADDSGLVVDALGGAPGVQSARYAADNCPPNAGRDTIDAANNAKLLAAMEGVPDSRRTARFVCHLALADAERIIIEASGTIEGRIGWEGRGENGFGYDPLFYVPNLGCTTAQLPPDEKNAVSHRGKAVRRIAELLKELLADA